MTECIAQNIAFWLIKKSEDETLSLPVLKYSLSVILNLLFGILLTCIFGLITGEVTQALKSLLYFSLLRFFSGGFHFKSLDVCVIVSALLFSGVPLVPPMASYIVFILTTISLVLILIMTPSMGENQPIGKRKFIYKITAVVIVSINFFGLSQLYAITIFIQSLTLIPRRRGE